MTARISALTRVLYVVHHRLNLFLAANSHKSADADACVPYYASETWTRELGFTEIEAWRPWTAGSMDAPNDSSIRAGYVITYATRPGHNFTFATVAGAGHMVPTHKPPQALALLRRFLANEPL